MEFADVVRSRHMVRTYLDRPVPREVLDAVLDAGVRAPSAGFTQGTRFVVLDEPAQTAAFWSVTARSGEPPAPGTRWARMRSAPVVVVVLAGTAAYAARYAEPDKAGASVDHRWPIIDASFAVMSMLLAATDAGLGALYFAVTDGQQELLDHLRVPPAYESAGAVTIGWPAPDDLRSPSLARGRQPRSDVVRYGRFDT